MYTSYISWIYDQIPGAKEFPITKILYKAQNNLTRRIPLLFQEIVVLLLGNLLGPYAYSFPDVFLLHDKHYQGCIVLLLLQPTVENNIPQSNKSQKAVKNNTTGNIPEKRLEKIIQIWRILI